MTSVNAHSLAATKIFHAEVVSTEALGPHFVRVVIGGGDIPVFESIGPDQFLYVFVPKPGDTDHDVPHDFSWDLWRERPESERQVGRYYSVRHHDAERAELTLEFVRHGSGPLTTWAGQALPGDKLALWGPRKGFDPPPETENYLLFADETGLPALSAVVESLPSGATARAIIEVPDAAAEREFETAAAFDVTWLHRDGAPVGVTTILSDTVREVRLPPGQVYAWGAGEFRAMNVLRKHLREGLGLPPSAASVIAYWRHKDHADDEGEKS